jgi:osmotically-inducible protein OsmY
VVEWQLSRQDTYCLVDGLLGVKGVNSLITLKPQVTSSDVHTRIEAALKLSSEFDANCIHVEAEDGSVTLCGILPRWIEIDAAVLVIWNVAGVTAVDNQINIGLQPLERRPRAPFSVSGSDKPPGHPHCGRHPNLG